MKKYIYLDDIRTPSPNPPSPNPTTDDAPVWIIVRSYTEFVDKVNEIGLDDIQMISLDHDLGISAVQEWKNNHNNYTLDYNNITEMTGYDCAKWLVDQWMNGKPVVSVMTHSANPIGSANIMGYINNYRHIHKLPQNCLRIRISHTV